MKRIASWFRGLGWLGKAMLVAIPGGLAILLYFFLRGRKGRSVPYRAGNPTTTKPPAPDSQPFVNTKVMASEIGSGLDTTEGVPS